MGKQKETESSKKSLVKKLSKDELRWKCPTKRFKFKSTEEVEPLTKIVGQPRAIESIRLGAELFSKGYNIFVTGLSGTGRLTTVKKVLEDITTVKPKKYDYCYVHNFGNPDQPRLIKLEAGKGKAFSKAMKDSITYLKDRLPKLFEEDSFQKRRKKIIQEYQEKEKKILEEFDDKIKPEGFVRGQIETEQGIIQPEIFPIVNDKPVQIEKLDELVQENKISKEEAEKLAEKYKKYKPELFKLAKQGLKIMREFKKSLYEHDKAAASLVIDSVFGELKEEFPLDAIKKYIEEVKDYITENLSLFVSTANPAETPPEAPSKNEDKEKFDNFKVNVILDNSDTKSPPVVVETNPTYTNLFGTIERSFDSRGFWRTDFSKIKAGSILKADQGYLIVNALDIFLEPGVWPVLKRVLQYDKLEIQPYEAVFQLSQLHLKPEPIEVNFKIILIGGQTLYRFLYAYEKGFKKIFKVIAQFDYETEKNDDLIDNYAQFVSKICKEDKLPHFDRGAVSAIVEWGTVRAGSQRRITLKFSDVADIVREAAFYKKSDKKKGELITKKDVETAIECRRHRNDLLDEKLKYHILEGNTLIDTEGERVGQINGLTIIDTGILSIGKPARITASVSAGDAGIINIEREADMSGSIHNKGVLIISGFMRERFAGDKTLSLTASLAFEQNYGGIDGDSASAAEIYAILSAIADIPIKQSIAITGSVNQKGDIQPIGGVNEKIRGYYEICKERGLRGDEGVIIPVQNVKDLMLKKEIIEAVENNKFSVYPIEKIEDGVEILMGLKPGRLTKSGAYTRGSLFYKVSRKLDQLREAARKKKQKKSGVSSKSKSKGSLEGLTLEEVLKIEALNEK